jgi:hypothetical protein
MMVPSNPLCIFVTVCGTIISCLANHENGMLKSYLCLYKTKFLYFCTCLNSVDISFTVYMEDYCNKKIRIKSSQNMLLSEDMFYPTGWRCQTTLEAPPNHVIWINFQYFDVGRPSVIYCTDVLRVYDGIYQSLKIVFCGLRLRTDLFLLI